MSVARLFVDEVYRGESRGQQSRSRDGPLQSPCPGRLLGCMHGILAVATAAFNRVSYKSYWAASMYHPAQRLRSKQAVLWRTAEEMKGALPHTTDG